MSNIKKLIEKKFSSQEYRSTFKAEGDTLTLFLEETFNVEGWSFGIKAIKGDYMLKQSGSAFDRRITLDTIKGETYYINFVRGSMQDKSFKELDATVFISGIWSNKND